MRKLLLVVLVMACFLVAARQALASTITVFYGDADGFGIGAMTTLDPTVSHASPGEAPFTDLQLIGDSQVFSGPAFAPTGSFDAYVIPAGEMIIAATLTMSAGAWDVGASPVDGANTLMLDGLAVPTSFFSLFTANNGLETPAGANTAIETQSLVLSSTIFPLLADGLVSLNGTHLSEQDGSGSFQIDFLRLDIETQGPAPIPEPTSIALLSVGLVAACARTVKRKRAAE
jgi:hypothetical protein